VRIALMHYAPTEATVEGEPVCNVSIPVIERDFWIFELEAAPGAAPVH
jgi:hypothetical protein